MVYKKKLQLGATPSLRTQPILNKIETLFDEIDFHPLDPKEIVNKMRSKELDIALLPSSELFMRPNYSIIPEISISCEGDHSGCVLYSKVLPDQINKIYIDKGAYVEYHLAQLIVPRLLMVRPSYHESEEYFSPDYDYARSPYDAFLIYGEDAYKIKHNFALSWDLGAAWVKMKGMPFVMYVWAVRWGVEIGNLENKLITLKENGMREIESIAVREAKIRGVDIELSKTYLNKSLRFGLSPMMISSLRHFNRMMFEEDICEKQLPVRFYNRTHTDYSGVI